MSEALKKLNNDLRKKSGTVKSNDPLVCFLYLLMRDHVSTGVISKITNEVISNNEEHTYTNGYMAEFAKYVAEKLKMAMMNNVRYLPKKGDKIKEVEIDRRNNIAEIKTDRGVIVVHIFEDENRNILLRKRPSKFYHGYEHETIKTLQLAMNVNKKVLAKVDKYVKKYGMKCGPAEEYETLKRFCEENGETIEAAFEAVTSKRLLEENEIRLQQNEEEFKDTKEFVTHFLKKNLRIDVEEGDFGFNGRSLNIELVLCDEIVSEGIHILKEDEG